jgi:hypothetical protein
MLKRSSYMSSGNGPLRKLACWVILLSCAGLFSCAPKHVEIPSFEEIPLDAALSELQRTASIEAVLSVEYEKNDGVMNGDAILRLSDNSLTLRLYYLGFLAGEVAEEEGVIRSTPKLDRNRRVLLVDGLRSCFFWWDADDYEVEDRGDHYLLRNASRSVLVSRKTLLPVEQTIETENGDMLRITYDAPAYVHADTPGQHDLLVPSDWYQSQITIRLREHTVKVAVKSYILTRR